MSKKYPPVKLAVPQYINYTKLFESLVEMGDIERKHLKDSTYLFLSFLIPTQSYIDKYEKKRYFKSINSRTFNKLTRNRFKKVKDILLAGSCIEENPSYQKGVESKSFRLKPYYFSQEVRFVTIQSKISENYSNFINSKNKEKEVLNSKYQYLIRQYDQRITISSAAESYVNLLENEISENSHDQQNNKKSNPSFKEEIQLKIHYMRNIIKKINEGNFEPSMTVSNHRLNSVLTQMKKELRSYLLINNNPVAEVDISGSHLYVLAGILNEDFFTSTTDEFSLYTIYNELYCKLYNSNSDKSISSIINTYINNNNILPPPFMCGTFEKEIKQYKELFDGNDIYENINQVVFYGTKTRKQVKDGMMNFLNQNKFRNNIEFISEIKKHFPYINDFIENIQKLSTHKSCIAILLQRVESYLLLQVGCRELLKQIPDLCYFTIHDSVAVEESKAPKVMEILQRVISEKTGVPIKFKVKQF